MEIANRLIVLWRMQKVGSKLYEELSVKCRYKGLKDFLQERASVKSKFAQSLEPHILVASKEQHRFRFEYPTSYPTPPTIYDNGSKARFLEEEIMEYSISHQKQSIDSYRSELIAFDKAPRIREILSKQLKIMVNGLHILYFIDESLTDQL